MPFLQTSSFKHALLYYKLLFTAFSWQLSYVALISCIIGCGFISLVIQLLCNILLVKLLIFTGFTFLILLCNKLV